MLLAYTNLRGYFDLAPLTPPYDNGISTLILSAYTTTKNTIIVAITGINKLKFGCPVINEYINAGILPAGADDAAVGKKLSEPTRIVCATPAAMNNPIPLPNPHLLTTSSI